MGNMKSGLRTPPAQSRFGPWFYETPDDAMGDVTFVGILSFFVSLAVIQFLASFGLFSQILNIRDKKERWEFIKRSAVRYACIFFMIFLGWAILGSNFAYTWREGYVDATVPYRAGSAEHIHARIGLHVGLRGINVTLVGLPTRQHCQLINWNEQYLWSEGQNELGGWLQGRFGVGPYSNLLAQQFRAGQARGTPLPILEVLEWLTIDGEKIRWNRWFLFGGYYCHVFLWLAFTFWVLTIIVTFINPATGALWLALTGCAMWFAAALYHGLTEKANPDLKIPFDGGFIEPKFGWAYHLTLVLGILVNLLGIALYAGFTYFGFKTDAFTLSTKSGAPVSSFNAQEAELVEVKEQEAADKSMTDEEGEEEEPKTGFRAPSKRQVTFARSFSVMQAGIRKPSFPEPDTMGQPRDSNGSIQGLAAPSTIGGRSSRRTKKLFGRPTDSLHVRSARPTTNNHQHTDTFDDLAGVLDTLGKQNELAVLSEAAEEEEEEMPANKTNKPMNSETTI
eukprot:m.58403 g.58403  ORF g.58403 m.58403 type:complete len:507 (-) comp13147_c0_seq1:547-2067(-)